MANTGKQYTDEELEDDGTLLHAALGARVFAGGPLWNTGPGGGLIARERIIAVGRWDSAPLRRAAQVARAENRLIDLTFGYACQSVIFMDSGHIVLTPSTYLYPEPIPFEATADDPRTEGRRQ